MVTGGVREKGGKKLDFHETALAGSRLRLRQAEDNSTLAGWGVYSDNLQFGFQNAFVIHL